MEAKKTRFIIRPSAILVVVVALYAMTWTLGIEQARKDSPLLGKSAMAPLPFIVRIADGENYQWRLCTPVGSFLIFECIPWPGYGIF